MKKGINAIILLFLAAAGFPGIANAADSLPLSAYFFYGNGCPHCRQERQYLGELESRYPSFKIYEFEIYENRENLAIMKESAKTLGASVNGVPFLIIGNRYFIGYLEGTTSEEIKKRVNECTTQPCSDSIAAIVERRPEDKEPVIINGRSEEKEIAEITADAETFEAAAVEKTEAEEAAVVAAPDGIKINVPFFGELDAASFSLPAITVIMGALDGFNPCAMWALLFLISLLLGIKNRRRMWILGSAFIVSSALVYFLFMAAWLNLILFFGFIVWVRLAIGALALAGGAYSIRESLVNKSGGCKVAGDEKKRRVFERLKELVYRKSFWLALGGMIVLAFAVNMVELICSAGLPAVYAQVLAINNVSEAQRYIYLALYVLVFMLDDLFVFFAAMITMKMTGITTKYARLSRLAGGIILLLIGVFLILKPEWLMFG